MFKPNRRSTACERGTTTTRKQQQQHRFQRGGEKKRSRSPPEEACKASVDVGISLLLVSQPRRPISSSVCVRLCVCAHAVPDPRLGTRAVLADRTRPPYVAAASRMWSYKAALLAFITCVPALSRKPRSRPRITACTPTTCVCHRWKSHLLRSLKQGGRQRRHQVFFLQCLSHWIQKKYDILGFLPVILVGSSLSEPHV